MWRRPLPLPACGEAKYEGAGHGYGRHPRQRVETSRADIAKHASVPGEFKRSAACRWEAFAGFSPLSRVQPRQGKVFGAIVMPYCALYRSNCSRFDSFNMRWVR